MSFLCLKNLTIQGACMEFSNHRRFKCAQNAEGDLGLKVAPVPFRGMLLPDLYRASEYGRADVIERCIVWCFLCAISWSMYTARKTAKSNTETQISGGGVLTLQFYHAQPAHWPSRHGFSLNRTSCDLNFYVGVKPMIVVFSLSPMTISDRFSRM